MENSPYLEKGSHTDWTGWAAWLLQDRNCLDWLWLHRNEGNDFIGFLRGSKKAGRLIRFEGNNLWLLLTLITGNQDLLHLLHLVAEPQAVQAEVQVLGQVDDDLPLRLSSHQ